MTAIGAKALRKLAKKATPGPWESRDAVDEGAGVHAVVVGPETRIVASTGRFPDLQAKPDAHYLAAVDPQTVTALLDDLDELLAELELAHNHHDFGPEHCTPANCSAAAALAKPHR